MDNHVNKTKNIQLKKNKMWLRILVLLLISSVFISALFFIVIFTIHSLLWAFNLQHFKKAFDVFNTSFNETIDISPLIISCYLLSVLMFCIYWFMKLTKYGKNEEKSFIYMFKRVFSNEIYRATLGHVIEYRLVKNTNVIMSVFVKIFLAILYLFPSLFLIMLLLLIVIVFLPGTVKEFIKWWNNVLSNASLDISNLAIVIFTLVLVWIEYMRYKLEFAHPKIEVIYLVRHYKELIFKIFVANVSKIPYVFEGSYLIPPGKEGVVWFREQNPLEPLVQDPGIYNEIDKSMVRERKVFVPREQSVEYYITLPVDSKMEEGFFVLFTFSYSRPKRILLPWEIISSYMGIPQQLHHSQFFVYFVDLKEDKAELVAQL